MNELSNRIAGYHLPGLFEFYELYRLFLPLFREHPEYFYDWCEIGSVYGAPGASTDGSFQLILPGSFTKMAAWKGKRRKKHGHQGCSSKQISVKNYFQHEEYSVCPKK